MIKVIFKNGEEAEVEGYNQSEQFQITFVNGEKIAKVMTLCDEDNVSPLTVIATDQEGNETESVLENYKVSSVVILNAEPQDLWEGQRITVVFTKDKSGE